MYNTFVSDVHSKHTSLTASKLMVETACLYLASIKWPARLNSSVTALNCRILS